MPLSGLTHPVIVHIVDRYGNAISHAAASEFTIACDLFDPEGFVFSNFYRTRICYFWLFQSYIELICHVNIAVAENVLATNTDLQIQCKVATVPHLTSCRYCISDLALMLTQRPKDKIRAYLRFTASNQQATTRLRPALLPLRVNDGMCKWNDVAWL